MTLDWVKENNYATVGDYMGFEEKTCAIIGTNMNEISMTLNPNPESYSYSIDVNGNTLHIDNVKIPCSKH